MIQIRIAFVLRLVDDFTGACIKRKSFRFWTDEKILHPVQKEEGLYVFLEPLEHPARITIEGTDYYPCTVEVDKHILDPEEPIADIRLYGRSGKVYSGSREYRTGVLNIKGQELPAEVYIRREKPTGLMYREYRKLENSHWILFQGFTKEDLIGKTCVLGRERDAFPFIIMEKRGINEYRIEPCGPVPDQIKEGEPLARIYRSVTDQDGSYAIPVEAGEGQSTEEVMLLHYKKPARKKGGRTCLSS